MIVGGVQRSLARTVDGEFRFPIPSEEHVFQEGGEPIEVLTEVACDMGKRPQVVSYVRAEVVGLTSVTAGASFDERACTVESFGFFMHYVIDVPRLSAARANNVHGVFLHVADVDVIGGRRPPGSRAAAHAGGKGEGSRNRIGHGWPIPASSSKDAALDGVIRWEESGRR
jgi:hypothetical protein